MIARLLIAEDDPHIRQGLVATLESEGYDVTSAGDGAQALKLYPQGKFELVLLDVMMPRASGYEVCRELRAGGATVPILFLTAKGEEVDKIVGLKLGGDDYLVKPFGVGELLARVEALLRRSRLAQPPLGAGAPAHSGASAHAVTASPLPEVFQLGTAVIDRRTFSVRLPGRPDATLTARELKLAETFASHPGRTLTRDALLNTVWGVSYFGTTRTLDQHVAQLRKKIEPDPESPATLITVHGIGYRCVAKPC